MAMVGSPNRASINSATTGHSGSSNQRIAVSVAKRIRLSITPSANLDILRAFCASRRRYNPLLSQNHVGKVEVCVAALGAKSVRTDVLLKLDARGGFALGALFGSAFVRITATGTALLHGYPAYYSYGYPPYGYRSRPYYGYCAARY